MDVIDWFFMLTLLPLTAVLWALVVVIIVGCAYEVLHGRKSGRGGK
jgi:hypothetical protein